jgi:hypothetical protein
MMLRKWIRNRALQAQRGQGSIKSLVKRPIQQGRAAVVGAMERWVHADEEEAPPGDERPGTHR